MLLLLLLAALDPPGHLIAIGQGTRLHLYCTGAGSPTVILEAGYPGSYLDWIRVQPGVAAFTRVCSYDRAGFGWSDASPLPRTALRIADELHQLLKAAHVDGPLVMVAHSLGALYAKAYLRRFPLQIQRAVLIDPFPFETNGAPLAHPAASVLKRLEATPQWRAALAGERAAMRQNVASYGPAPPGTIILRAAGIPGAHHYLQLSNPQLVINAIRQACLTRPGSAKL